MLNQAEIANLALGRLGVTLTITDVDTDESQQGKIVRRHWKTSLEYLLEHYQWGFATAYESLALVEENPNDSFGFSYRCPADCVIIRLIGTSSDLADREDYIDERNLFEEAYDDAGTLIYTNIGDACARYTKRVADSYAFPNHFGRALSAQLALDMAPSLITNNFGKVRNLLITDAEREINKGISDDLNRKPRPEDSQSKFVRARL